MRTSSAAQTPTTPQPSSSERAASVTKTALAALALALGWGIVGVWAALDVLIVTRLALLAPRFARRRWAVVGWGLN